MRYKFLRTRSPFALRLIASVADHLLILDYQAMFSAVAKNLSEAPYHAHIYYVGDERDTASALRERFAQDPDVLFVGSLADRPLGPHPLPQFEVHFQEMAVSHVMAAIQASGLRALIHPLTNDDLADHTSHACWIGPPLQLDERVLDPPGMNQGLARFGKE